MYIVQIQPPVKSVFIDIWLGLLFVDRLGSWTPSYYHSIGISRGIAFENESMPDTIIFVTISSIISW